MIFFDDEEEKKKNIDEIEDDNSDYYVEEDDLKVVFSDETSSGSNVEKVIIDEEEEIVPQDNEEYILQSKIIEDETESLAPRYVSEEMRKSFLEYAMSVIVSRALPDARDGLKPVHRRILYAMSELNLTSSAQYKKSARIVGEVLGKFHPHGDSSIYGAMVRMAQDFSMRYPLIDGHGNFGSIDGDDPAAMRYTEARMSKIAGEMLEGIKKNTVNFVPNYDESEMEPTVLPAGFPNLLVTGSVGIAVGMATTIPPHNLGEIIDGVIALAKNEEITIEELMEFVHGPDFPTGAIILGKKGIIDAFTTGRGSIKIRSKTHIEVLKNGRARIVVTEIPYDIKKPALIEKIAMLVKEKKIEGISDLRDETSRKGIRLVVELKKNVIPEVTLNQLYKMTNLQSNYSVNTIALVDGEPKLLTLKDALKVYLDHQIEVVIRRSQFDLDKAEARQHILEGLKIATQNIDETIKIIRASRTDQEAQDSLMSKFNLSEKQSKAIVDMRLGRLTGLAIEKMNEEINNLTILINELKTILGSREKQIELIIEELTVIREKFADDRRTEIDINNYGDISNEDLIPVKPIIISMSTNGYVKRIPLVEYRVQRRGGVGVQAQTTYSDDDVFKIVSTTTHTDILIFTSKAKVFRLRAHQIPEMSRQSKGIPFINLINIEKDEKVVSLLATNSYESGSLVTITKRGVIKRTRLSEYERINRNGKIALSLKEEDKLINAMIVSDNEEIIIGSNNGKVVRFNIDQIRFLSRTATGVIAMKFSNSKEYAIGASNTGEGNFLLSIGAEGFAKKTPIEEYRETKRGAKGVKSINDAKAGKLVYVGIVEGNEDIMLVTNKGVAIRTNLDQVNTTSRATKGVKIIKIDSSNTKINSVTIINSEKIEKEVEEEIRITQELALEKEKEQK